MARSPLPEMWSPHPVIGFRYWKIDLDGLHGIRGHRWDGPVMRARCRPRRGAPAPGEIPHTAGECGWPPCGIYALRDPRDLVTSYGRDSAWSRLVVPERPLLEPGAFGAVSLTGRVVEHERGYRAAGAGAIGLVVVAPRWLAVVEHPDEVRRVFRDPMVTVRTLRRVEVEEVPGGWEEARWMVVARLFEMRERAAGAANRSGCLPG